MPPPRPIIVVADPDGRQVLLDMDGWEHIVRRHPELASHQASVVAAVQVPTLRRQGRVGGEHWFYLQGSGVSRWLKVVVRYTGSQGRIVTAFPRRSIP